MRPGTTALLLVILYGVTASADDFSYVSDEELVEELAQRQQDVARTTNRLNQLTQSETAALTELDRARIAEKEIENLVAKRAAVFYRISRHGGSLRYLLGASSPTGLLKRLSHMRHLLHSSLESRRQAGLSLAEAKNRLATIRQQKISAQTMLTMSVEARDELLSEQLRRNTTTEVAVR
jgi:hypothetical protein